MEIIDKGSEEMKFEFGNIGLVAKGLKLEVVRSSSCSNSRRKPSGQGGGAVNGRERKEWI